MLGALLLDKLHKDLNSYLFRGKKPPPIQMKYYHYLFAILILGAISCSKKDVEENNSSQSTTQTQASTEPEPETKSDSDSNSTTEPNEPTEDENNDPGKHTETAKSLMAVMNSFIDNLSTVRDVESAETAVAKFEDMAASFETIANDMESLGLPSGQEAEAIRTLFSDTEKQIQEKMAGIMGFLLGDQEVGKIITPALEKFGQRMDKLSPLMEQWSGNASQSSEPGQAPVNEIPLEEAVEKIDE